jgi:hypothetical protein
VVKIGRTRRLAFRIRNLRAGIFRDHSCHIIQCGDSQESLRLEKYLRKAFHDPRLVREWFSGVTLEDAERVLSGSEEYAHLMIGPYEFHPSGLIMELYRLHRLLLLLLLRRRVST